MRQAIVRLGLAEVEKLTVAMGAMRVFSAEGLPRNYFKDFWTHSIMVALTTREIIASSEIYSTQKIDINHGVPGHWMIGDYDAERVDRF